VIADDARKDAASVFAEDYFQQPTPGSKSTLPS
jgi:hypothetical protein